MGIFSKKRTATVQIIPLDYYQMVDYFGLPPGTSIRDGAFHKMWMPVTVDIPENDNAPYLPVQLVNKGGAVEVQLGGRTMGKLDPNCLPDAVQVFKHYGQNQAPAFLSHTSKGKTYSITCIDPAWDGSILT
jgi:hypothetical protein